MTPVRQRRARCGATGVLRPFAPLHFWCTCWSMRPLAALLIVAAVALPWYAAVGLRTEGAWLREFFLQHNVGRALQPMEGHAGGPWYYPLAMLVGLFPWSILALPVLVVTTAGLRQAGPARNGYVFCACWVGVYVVLFSFARTKLPSYVTPAYPAAALLIGCFLRQWVANPATIWRGWMRTAWAVLSLVGAVLVVALIAVTDRFLPDEHWLAAVGLIPLLGGVACWAAAESGRRQVAAACLTVTAACFCAGLLGVATDRVDRHQQSHILLRAIASRAVKPQVAALGQLEPSWVFYGGQPIRFIPTHNWRDAISFLQTGTDRFLITTDNEFQRLRPQLPREIDLLESVPYFLKRSQLVLIGPSPKPTLVAEPAGTVR